jgi:hypothetical protein
MTQEDFTFIIYESFDHLPALHSYLKKKRKDLKCIRSEYAFGLTMAFKTISEAVNQRDYNHVMFTKPDGETIEYELEAGHHAEQIFHLQTTENLKGAKISFPKKIVLDLRLITNGRFKRILTAAHMEHLSPLLDAYLRSIEPVVEPVHESSQPIPPDFIKENTEQMQKSPKEKTIIGSIENELNVIRERYRNCGERSETYVRYYNQIDQLTHVKDILTKELIPFDNYFGGYWDRLNNPLVYWTGFYIQPSMITELADLIAERRIIYNEKFIMDINEISEYIFAYKEGFMLGYEKFDSIEIENKSSVFKSDKLSIEKIINYIENHKERDNGGFTFQFYPKVDKFPFSNSSDGTISPRVAKIPFSIEECRERQLSGVCSERILHEQQTGNECHACFPFTLSNTSSWKSKGFEGGKYYRAWFIMLANYQIFDEYFKSKMKPALFESGTPQPMVNIPVLKDNNRLKEQAQNILIVLSGRWINKKKIMTDEEYIRVIEGINYLIDNEQVKLIDKKIDALAPMQFIRKLFREVNTKLYGKRIKDCIIEFLHVYFECFGDSEVQTTKGHFNEYRNSIYDADYKDVMETIGK